MRKENEASLTVESKRMSSIRVNGKESRILTAEQRKASSVLCVEDVGANWPRLGSPDTGELIGLIWKHLVC